MLPVFLGGVDIPKPLICNGSNSRSTISDSKVICKIGINKFYNIYIYIHYKHCT